MLNIKKKVMMAATTAALGAMLIGAGTFALFTGTANNNNNYFEAGTVEISLGHPIGSTDIHYTNMKPTDDGDNLFTVNNDGSLPVTFTLSKSFSNPDGKNLGGALQVSIFDDQDQPVALDTQAIELGVGASKTFKIHYLFPDGGASDNGYQGASTNLTITATATQQ